MRARGRPDLPTGRPSASIASASDPPFRLWWHFPDPAINADVLRAVRPSAGAARVKKGMADANDKAGAGAAETLAAATDRAARATVKLDTLITQMADGVVISDASGDALTINRAATEMLGDAAAALSPDFAPVPPDAPLLRHPDGRPFSPGEFPWRRACASGAVTKDVEMVAAHSAAREVRLSVNATPLRDEGGAVTGAVAVFRDVTETRRLIDELLEANRRLEEFNRLKAEFVANMSHELRTPLTAIIGFAQLMQTDAADTGALAPPHADALERILRNSRHLLSLIDDVLDLSKIEVGRIAVHPDHIDLVETVQAAFSELQSLARQKGLEYRLHVRDELPLAYTDPLRVRQIVINLLSNAIKFTPRGRVEAELSRAGEERWRLAVRDTGVGLKPEALDFIFERFRQVDGSTTRAAGGVGLGLTIVRQLVRLLGGEIEVESSYGAGSTFGVTLPLSLSRDAQPDLEERPAAPPAPTAAGLSAAAAAPPRHPLILVIEDDADAASLLSETLARAGYQPRVARGGAEGLALARDLLPDAITLDIMMPSVDGWRILQSLKADARTAQIPVIVCSIVDNRPLGYRLGASDYMLKPVGPERLLRALRGMGVGAERDGGYVLVVDDEQGIRTLIHAALHGAGYAARAAASGAIALRMATAQPPRAVLCDLVMPGGMSGFELIARLRADCRTADVPIVVITAKDVSPQDMRLIGGQIADVIRKGDLLLPDLETRLREALEEIGVPPTYGEDTAG